MKGLSMDVLLMFVIIVVAILIIVIFMSGIFNFDITQLKPN